MERNLSLITRASTEIRYALPRGNKPFAKRFGNVVLSVLLLSSSQVALASTIVISYDPLTVEFGKVEVPKTGTQCTQGVGSQTIKVGLTVKAGSAPKDGFFWKHTITDPAFKLSQSIRRMEAAKTTAKNPLQLHFTPTKEKVYNAEFSIELLAKSEIKDIIEAEFQQRKKEEEEKAKKKGEYLLPSDIKKIRMEVNEKYSDYGSSLAHYPGNLQQPKAFLKGEGVCNKPVVNTGVTVGTTGTGGPKGKPTGSTGLVGTTPKSPATPQPQPGTPKTPGGEKQQNQSSGPNFELNPGTNSIPGANSSGNPSGQESALGTFESSTGSLVDTVALVENLDPHVTIANDVNGDGFSDSVALDRVSQTVSVSIGNADESLQEAIHYPLSGQPSDIAVLDVTGDGLVDVITANQSSKDVSILVGEGGGIFGINPMRIHSEQDPNQLAATGLHASLIIDLALAVRFSDHVTLIRATNSVGQADQNAPVVGQLPKIVRQQASTWEMDGNGNLTFTGIDGLGYRYHGTTLTILDPANSGAEPRIIENVRKLVLTDSDGPEIDPYDL